MKIFFRMPLSIKVLSLFLIWFGLISLSNGAKRTVTTELDKKSKERERILEALYKAADWQLQLPFEGKKRWNENKKYDWVFGTFYAGLSDLHTYTNKKKYLDHMLEHGASLNWEPRARPYDANEYAMIQMYADVFEKTGDTSVIDKARFMAKMPLLRYLETDVRFKENTYWQDWWSWCDALFMAPPAFAKLGTVLDQPKYYDYLNEQWWKTSAYLYSEKDSLYYRDDTFFEQRSKNGKKVFWSRGNGWVLGGLVRVLDELPKDYPARKKFETQFVEMAHRIAPLQTEAGFWPSSLLDFEAYPAKETSGTAFFCYALTWGINNNLLEEKKFYPVIEKAWESLIAAQHPSGKLGYVQQIGDQPGNSTFEDEQAYGVGAFLMAGVELAEFIDRKQSTKNSLKKKVRNPNDE
ncbi:glycoside hydrolase family 88/105 protein [Maribacter sp. 2210JD10-5]|uniref:glycoside hydrolase family 88/105 protein n=1 Tax=Maribacter sp. 2210JD10-5 TaxID=3386272 RepID=UPI0039BD3F24